jgi:hypothetical protein
MQFVHQALTWGFLLALVPVLIHLINMMRHQRVQWAAMDFLLQSYKKHRRWVWLKQFLLLLARMVAIALVVAMLAQWITQRQWLNLFGGASTHHYILVDDSYSMSERSGGASAFDLARQVVAGIALRAGESDMAQRLTLIRYSQAARVADESGSADTQTRLALAADFNSATVDSNFAAQLEDKQASLDATQLAVGPRPALELIRQLLDGGAQELSHIHIVSDFRAGDWDKPAEARELLLEIERLGGKVELVQCSKSAQPNLGLTSIEPVDETRAAGVPLFVNVTVKNFGAAPARRIPIKVRTIFSPPDVIVAGDSQGAWQTIDEFPATFIEELAPGASVTHRIQVYFPQQGPHIVEAELPDDAVLADNRRWVVIDFPAGETALIVDGAPDQRNAYYVQNAFQPGEQARTGILPEVKPPAYLRDVSPAELATYRSIYLLDIDRLDDSAIRNLEQYVAAGGGVAFFMGPNCNLRFYTERLYRLGEGLFPLPLEREDVLPPPIDDRAVDIEVFEHPVFTPLLGERNPLVYTVNVETFVRPPATWKVPVGSTVFVAARLRNRSPLVVEKRLGKGRVMAFLTTLAPEWNNWAPNPSLVVVLLRLQSHLVGHEQVDATHVVGAPLDVDLDAKRFTDQVRWVVPGTKRGARVPLERTAVRAGELWESSLGRSSTASGAESTDRAGVYEAWARATSGSYEVRRFAVNVESEEGDLALIDGQALLNRLAPLKAGYQLAEQFQAANDDGGGVNRSMLLMAFLIALMLGEQFLAYLLGYHPPPAATAASVARLSGARFRASSPSPSLPNS